MNNQQTKTNRKTKKPYHLFTYFCLLLAVATMCMGATFARYATSSQGGVGVGVVHLDCSFSVDEVSSTTFSNSDYWLNIHDEHQAQNHPREIVFSVHNYEKNADGKNSAPSEIDLQSTFRFYAPKEFLENIAFQILKKGDGNTRIPLTQQYVLPTIIDEVVNKGTQQISTSDFKMTLKKGEEEVEEPADYGEYAGREEETLTLTNQDFDATNGTGKLVAIAQTGDGEQVATIALTAEKHTDVEYEITQVRGNESIVDAEHDPVNDMSAPEYYSIHKADEMVFYCLDISLPSMILQAKQDENGTFQQVDGQYVFAFTIIKKDVFDEPKDSKVAEHFNVKGVSLYSDTACQTLSKTAVIKVINTLGADGITSSEYYVVEDTAETKIEVSGSTVNLNGTTYYINADTQNYLNNPGWNPLAETSPQPDNLPYKIGATVKKVFPTDMRVLFTQASQTGGN